MITTNYDVLLDNQLPIHVVVEGLDFPWTVIEPHSSGTVSAAASTPVMLMLHVSGLDNENITMSFSDERNLNIDLFMKSLPGYWDVRFTNVDESLAQFNPNITFSPPV